MALAEARGKVETLRWEDGRLARLCDPELARSCPAVTRENGLG
jgi:hypothetical protein